MNLKNFNAVCYSRWQSERNIIISVLILLIFSCSSPLYSPTKENVAPTANLDKLKKGRQLYVNKCSSCHTLFLPEKFNRAQWTEAVNHMQQKAQITDEEKELIIDYLSKGKK